MKFCPRISILFFILLSSQAISSPEKELRPYSGQIIKQIDIVRKNVFDDEMLYDPPFYYRWANSLHILTREKVLRLYFLFNIGDSLDIEKVIETERNLRSGGFIGEITIDVFPDSAGGVDLTVITTDLWTTKASVYTDVAGGKYSVGISGIEQNLIGLGKMVQIGGQVSNDQNGGQFAYFDPRLFGTRQMMDLAYSYFNFDKGYTIILAQPRFSLSVPYQYQISLNNMHIRHRLFKKGNEFFRFRNDRILDSFDGVYSIGRSTSLDLEGGYVYENNNFSPDKPDSILNYLIPKDEDFSYPLFGVGASIIHYDIERFLDGAGTPEDLTLGAAIRFKQGFSNKSLGATFEGTYQAGLAQFLFNPLDGIFVGGYDKVSWWSRNGANERIRHISEMAIYYKPAMTHLLAFHALTDFAWRQLPVYQVFLGGGNGLRGHSFYEFAGSKLALGNIEYRFYLPVEILTVRLGLAAFFDIGNVWSPSDRIHLSQLKSDVGLGFRFGLTRSSTSRVINLDFARSLSDNNLFISFGATAPFSLDFVNNNE
jgi:outer membrane protein assembly factor BamA